MKNNSFRYVKWTLLAAMFPMVCWGVDSTTTTTTTQSSTTTSSEGVSTENTSTTTSQTPTAEVPKAKLAPKSSLLPDDMKVYYNEKVGLSRSAFKGAKENVLPTNNEYNEIPGCYIACYSKDAKVAPQLGAYPVGDNTYIMGQVRVKGSYQNGHCIPSGFEGKDIRASKEMKDTCEKSFPAMCEKSSCWANSQISTLVY